MWEVILEALPEIEEKYSIISCSVARVSEYAWSVEDSNKM